MNEFTERWRTRLFAAQTDLIDAYGGCKRVVEKHNISKSQVGRWYGGSDRDEIGTPMVMTMEAYVGRPIVSAIMLEFLGLEVAGPREGREAECISALNAKLVEVTGRMMVETVRARADGIVTPNEAKRLRELSREAQRIQAEIDGHLAGVESGDDGFTVIKGGAA